MIRYYAEYDSPLGKISIVSDGKELKELRFVDEYVVHSDELPIFDTTRRWLDSYFSGKIPDFTPPLAPFGTLFHRRVWIELLSIPYGKTTTYGDIAKRIGCKSAQAVGNAVHNNPIAIIIPCHRVIGANGQLRGYAYGIDRKRQLLQIEKHIV